MTISQAKATITATEFIRWVKYYNDKFNEQDVIHWYLAQIAFEIYALKFSMCAKEGDKNDRNTIDKFLLKFTEKKPESDEEKEIDPHALAMAKAFWFGLVGHNPEARKLPKKVLDAEQKAKTEAEQNVRSRKTGRKNRR